MNFFRRLGLFIENRRLWVLIIGALLVVASIFGAMRLQMATGYETLISTDSQTYKDYTRFNQHFGSDTIMVIVAGNNITQLLKQQNLDAMEGIELHMAQNAGVLSALSPTSLIKQAQSKYPVPPSPQDIVVDPQTGQIRPEFKSSFPDDQHALITIVLKGDLSSQAQNEVVKDVENTAANASFTGVQTTVTGLPELWAQLETLMYSSLRNMLILAIFLMLLILALIFSVRGFFAWRWLPLGVAIIGIFYTLGAMGWLSTPITMVTMAIFPILIGLGVDYGIQFHNRYDEESRRGETAADAILNSITHIGPAIGIAIIAACLGFAALFFSPVPMVQDFGRMLIVGVAACYLAAMFLLLVILYWHDRRKVARTAPRNSSNPVREKVGFVERGLRRLAPWVIKSPAIIIPIALLATVGGLIADSHIETETDQTMLISQDLPIIKDLKALGQLTGGISSASVLVEASDVADPAVLTWMVGLEQRIKAEHADTVVGTTSVADLVLEANGGTMPQNSQQVGQILRNLPENIQSNLISANYSAANLVITLKPLEINQTETLNDQLRQDIANPPPPQGVNATLTGAPVIGIDLFNALTTGRVKMTLIGIGFILFGLLLLFRLNVIRAIAAALPIVLILGWSSGVMYLLGIKYTPLTATLGALILGIGTEFTILLMMRYEEERGKGNSPSQAMTTAITKIGRAIVASGLTVIGGFAALLIARDFPIAQDFGMVTMINVFFALVSTLVVLPTLIVSFDQWRERRRKAKPA